MAESPAEPIDRDALDANLCGFVATAYLLGARGSALRGGVQSTGELPPGVTALLRGLTAPQRTERARALAPQLALLTQALRARALRYRWLDANGARSS